MTDAIGSLLTDDEMDKIRADVEANSMPGTCNLLSRTNTRDSEGGFKETWGTATADVPCLVENLSNARMFQHEALVGFSLRAVSDWILTIPFDVEITEDMRVEHNNNVYNVTSVDDDPDWRINRRANLDRII